MPTPKARKASSTSGPRTKFEGARPEDAALFGKVYDVTPEGNFEDHTILNRLESVKLLAPDEEKKLASLRDKLLAARSSRIRPGWDDKVLADWNGLMIAALVKAAKALDHPEWLSLASRAFTFIVSKMTVDSRLVHSSRQGRGHVPAVAGDYANMIRAALHLYEATNDAGVSGPGPRLDQDPR